MPTPILLPELKTQWEGLLEPIYPSNELKFLVRLLAEEYLSLPPAKQLLNPSITLSAVQEAQIQQAINLLQQQCPYQYIFGYTQFLNLRWQVNKNVLIPRPETEELLQIAIQRLQHIPNLQAIEVCGGSGAFIGGLKYSLPSTTCFYTEMDALAIEVAQQNFQQHQLEISIAQQDVLQQPIPFDLQPDLFFANPPYVTPAEASLMAENVLAYEPHKALFTPADDPLLFYKAIAPMAFNTLKKGGVVLVEINEYYAEATAKLFQDHHFQLVEILTDFRERPRGVWAVKS